MEEGGMEDGKYGEGITGALNGRKGKQKRRELCNRKRRISKGNKLKAKETGSWKESAGIRTYRGWISTNDNQ